MININKASQPEHITKAQIGITQHTAMICDKIILMENLL